MENIETYSFESINDIEVSILKLNNLPSIINKNNKIILPNPYIICQINNNKQIKNLIFKKDNFKNPNNPIFELSKSATILFTKNISVNIEIWSNTQSNTESINNGNNINNNNNILLCKCLINITSDMFNKKEIFKEHILNLNSKTKLSKNNSKNPSIDFTIFCHFNDNNLLYSNIISKNNSIRLFVPGRVCLLGEHSDWAAGYRKNGNIHNLTRGYCIASGTNQGIHCDISLHPTKLIVYSRDSNNNKLEPFSIIMNLDLLRQEAINGGIFSYICGVAYYILLKHRVNGLVINNFKTTLPLKKGLSSSAAICVLVARAFNKMYNLKLTLAGEMDYAYIGERLTGSLCGKLDQITAYGQKPTLMTFDGDHVATEQINVKSDLYLCLVDLASSKDTKKILSDLNGRYKINKNDSVSQGVRKLFGEINESIIKQSIIAIKTGNVKRLGELMTLAQKEFDKYAIPACDELKAPVLHKLLNHKSLKAHIYGGKGVGSQGDGSAQFLCKSLKSLDCVVNIIKKDYPKMSCLKLTIGSNREILKAVIPTASYCSELFPATKAITNSLFPVLHNGVLKPGILVLVEEALECGINEIYIVINEHDYSSFSSLFYYNMPLSQYNKLPSSLQKLHDKILSYGKHIKLIIQKEVLGLGHAIYECKQYIKNEAFLLMLGDHLYKTKDKNNISCTQQLLNNYNGINLISLKKTNELYISSYGCVNGNWIYDNNNNSNNSNKLYINEICEKPSIEYAKKHLRVKNLKSNEYLTVFGLYILDGVRLIQILENSINLKIYGLTSAIEQLRKEQQLEGYIVNGRRYDIGTSPIEYIEAVSQFSKGVNSVKSVSTTNNNNNIIDID